MSAVVFLGPTLRPDSARSHLDADYHPPVRQGDVYRVVSQRRPRVIGIIDGYFRQVPAVWHKEILWAMTRGVHVFGAASMGALRAAELHAFGMRGIGRVFEAYANGVLAPFEDEAFEDDDEVAVVHGPAETGYVLASEAMVNLRCTLASAHARGVISRPTRDRLVRLAKDLFYAERSYPKLLALAARDALAPPELRALQAWLETGRIDQKRIDATALLQAIREHLARDPDPLQTEFAFQANGLWELAKASALAPASARAPIAHNAGTETVLAEAEVS